MAAPRSSAVSGRRSSASEQHTLMQVHRGQLGNSWAAAVVIVSSASLSLRTYHSSQVTRSWVSAPIYKIRSMVCREAASVHHSLRSKCWRSLPMLHWRQALKEQRIRLQHVNNAVIHHPM